MAGRFFPDAAFPNALARWQMLPGFFLSRHIVIEHHHNQDADNEPQNEIDVFPGHLRRHKIAKMID
jgi:hypothetical protein